MESKLKFQNIPFYVNVRIHAYFHWRLNPQVISFRKVSCECMVFYVCQEERHPPKHIESAAKKSKHYFDIIQWHCLMLYYITNIPLKCEATGDEKPKNYMTFTRSTKIKW